MSILLNIDSVEVVARRKIRDVNSANHDDNGLLIRAGYFWLDEEFMAGCVPICEGVRRHRLKYNSSKAASQDGGIGK